MDVGPLSISAVAYNNEPFMRSLTATLMRVETPSNNLTAVNYYPVTGNAIISWDLPDNAYGSLPTGTTYISETTGFASSIGTIIISFSSLQTYNFTTEEYPLEEIVFEASTQRFTTQGTEVLSTATITLSYDSFPEIDFTFFINYERTDSTSYFYRLTSTTPYTTNLRIASDNLPLVFDLNPQYYRLSYTRNNLPTVFTDLSSTTNFTSNIQSISSVTVTLSVNTPQNSRAPWRSPHTLQRTLCAHFVPYFLNVNSFMAFPGAKFTDAATSVYSYDPSFDNVSLLLHMNGENGSRTFIDSSSRNRTLSTVGNAQISTSIKRFGTGSGYFSTSADYILINNPPAELHNWYSSNYTLEAWVYLESNPTAPSNRQFAGGSIIGNATPGRVFYDYWSFGPITDRRLQFYYWSPTGGANTSLTTTTTLNLQQWHHVAFVKNGTNLKLYIDGIERDSETLTVTPSSTSGTPLVINGHNTHSLNGYIEDLRITSGVARYTSNFTPPVEPFPDLQTIRLNLNWNNFHETPGLSFYGEGHTENIFLSAGDISYDPQFSNTSLLARFNDWSGFENSGGFDGEVKGFLRQGDGKWIVYGNFTSYRGTACNRIVRLNANGNIDSTFSIGTGFNGIVNTAQFQVVGTTKILVGGAFTNYNGSAVGRIVRLELTGAIDTSFNSGGAGFGDGEVRTIAIIRWTGNADDQKAYVGGTFTLYNTVANENRIIRLNTNGSKDAGFVITPIVGAVATTNGFNGAVNSIVVKENDSQPYFGGEFTLYRNVGYNRILRSQSNGNPYSSTNFVVSAATGNGFNGTVRTLAINTFDNSTLLVGGAFTQYRTVGTNATRISRLNSETGAPETVTDSPNDGEIFNITVQANNKILVGGSFTQYKSLNYVRAARITNTGVLDTTFGATENGFNNTVNQFITDGGNRILAGGLFTTYKGKANNRLVALTDNGSQEFVRFPDASTQGHILSAFETNIVGANISSIQTLFGSNTLRTINASGFNGVILPANASLNFGSSNFAVECWIYPDTPNTATSIWSTHTNSNVQGCVLLITGTNRLLFLATSDGINWQVNLQAPTTDLVKFNTWQHVAVTRTGDIFRLFLDGKLVASTTSNIAIRTETEMTIGGARFVTSYNRTFGGYIGEFRVTRGASRYVSDFTRPSIPFTTNTTPQDFIWKFGEYTERYSGLLQSSLGSRLTAMLPLTSEIGFYPTIPISVQSYNSLFPVTAPGYYYDDVTGAALTYPYFASTVNVNNQELIDNPLIRQSIKILPYDATPFEFNPGIANTVYLPVLGQRVDYQATLKTSLAPGLDVVQPCYDKYGIRWNWGTLEQTTWEQQKKFTSGLVKWSSAQCMVSADTLSMPSTPGVYAKKWRTEGSLSSINLVPVFCKASPVTWTLVGENKRPSKTWSSTYVVTDPEESNNEYENIAAFPYRLQLSGDGVNMFTTSYYDETPVTLTVLQTISCQITAAPGDWQTKVTTLSFEQNINVIPPPEILLYTPNKFVLTGTPISFENLSTRLETVTSLVVDYGDNIVVTLTGESIKRDLVNTYTLNGAKSIKVTAHLNYDSNPIVYNFPGIIESIAQYDTVSPINYRLANEPIKLPHSQKIQIQPNEWGLAETFNACIKKFYENLEYLNSRGYIYEITPTAYYGWLGPVPTVVLQDLEICSKYTWEDFDCNITTVCSSTYYDKQNVTWTDATTANDFIGSFAVCGTWLQQTCSPRSVAPTCFGLYEQEWNWRSRKTKTATLPITWKQAKKNSVYQKRWYYEPSEITNNVICNEGQWHVDIPGLNDYYNFAGEWIYQNNCKYTGVVSRNNMLYTSIAKGIRLLSKDYQATYYGNRYLLEGATSFTDIKNISIDSEGKIFVLDGLLAQVAVYIVSDNGKFELLVSWGGYGSSLSRNKFFNPNDIYVDSKDTVWVTDTGNGCIKHFSNTGSWLKTIKDDTLKESSPLSVCIDSQHNLHVLTTNNIRVYSYTGIFLYEYDFTNYTSEKPVRINSSYNRERIYMCTNSQVLRFYRNGVFGGYVVQNKPCVDNITSVYQDEFRNVLVTTTDRIFKYPDLMTLKALKGELPPYYWSLTDLYIHEEEYVQNWVYNKSLQRLWDNIEFFRTTIRYQNNNDCKQYTGFKYDKKDINIGQNEIVTSTVLNRSLNYLWENFTSLIKPFDPYCNV